MTPHKNRVSRAESSAEAGAQARGASPVWILMCRVSWLGFWNVFPQCGHE